MKKTELYLAFLALVGGAMPSGLGSLTDAEKELQEALSKKTSDGHLSYKEAREAAVYWVELMAEAAGNHGLVHNTQNINAPNGLKDNFKVAFWVFKRWSKHAFFPKAPDSDMDNPQSPLYKKAVDQMTRIAEAGDNHAVLEEMKKHPPHVPDGLQINFKDVVAYVHKRIK